MAATEAERSERMGEARRAEREARTRLQELLAVGDRRLREAAVRLADFEAALEGIRAVLRRSGYLR